MHIKRTILIITILFAYINLALAYSYSKQENILNIKPEIQNNVFIDLATLLKNIGVAPTDIIQADKTMRVNVTEGIKEALLNQYSLVHLKEKRILTDDGQPFNTVNHLNKCVEIEKNTDDTSDLHFIDRLKQCIAGFQDTHLGINARIPTPTVTTGILIRKINNKYYIYARHPALLDYLKKVNDDDTVDEVTAIGNEVLSVDGKSPDELAKHYATFARASSDAFRNSVGGNNIFYRDFDYPVKNFVAITVKSANKIYDYRLPWWASSNTKARLDAKKYFAKIGIPTSDRVHMLSDTESSANWTNLSTGFQGYFENAAIIENDPFAPLMVFNKDNSDVPAARMGVITNQEQSFCYLELLTFATKNLTPANGGKAESYVNTIKNFVTSCKQKNLDLVMDLRSNNGGHGDYPYKVLSLIAKPDTQLGGKIIAYRANQMSARLISSLLLHPELNSGDLNDIDDRSLLEIERALPLQQLMTGALPVSRSVEPDPDVGGFSGNVLALVTPGCISACDGMTALLKRSGRGVLLGTHSNGTGAGFVVSNSIDSMYRDSYLEVEMKIPNYQFGYSKHTFPNLDPLDFDANADEYFTENRPTIADIQVDTTLDDIVGKKHTWLDAVVEQLNKLHSHSHT